MLLTNFLAELFGLFLVIFSISMFVHKEMFMELVHDIEHKRSTVYLLSVIAVLLGLLCVMLHNYWSGSVLTVVVTVVGWVILLKGALYLILPTKRVTSILRIVAFAKNYHLYATISLLLGLYLVVAAFATY